ncbi:MAG: lysoplasmalogenase family protein [Polymorphobacter sp.]
MKSTHPAWNALPVAGPVRWLVLASLAAGLAYPALADCYGLVADIAAKGLGVGLLGGAALLAGRPWLAAIMSAGAVGDMLLEVPGGFFFGAGAFAIGHVIAMVFYARQRRSNIPVVDRVAAAGVIGYGLVMPAFVMPNDTPVGALILYSMLLCGMAAAAALSRFSRNWVALGALLFVVSDTLLIMRLGGRLLGGATVHSLMVWYFYYFGQLGIAIGVLRGPVR